MLTGEDNPKMVPIPVELGHVSRNDYDEENE